MDSGISCVSSVFLLFHYLYRRSSRYKYSSPRKQDSLKKDFSASPSSSADSGLSTRSPTNINLEGIYVDSPVTDGVKPQPNGHGKSTAVKTSSSSMFSFKRPPKQASAETEKQGNSPTQQRSKRPDSQHYASKDVLSGFPAKKPMKVTSSTVSNASSTGAALPPLSSSYVGTSSISPGRRSKVIQMVSDLERHHSNSTEMTSCETGPVCDDDAEEEYYQDMVTSSAHSLELSGRLSNASSISPTVSMVRPSPMKHRRLPSTLVGMSSPRRSSEPAVVHKKVGRRIAQKMCSKKLNSLPRQQSCPDSSLPANIRR